MLECKTLQELVTHTQQWDWAVVSCQTRIFTRFQLYARRSHLYHHVTSISNFCHTPISTQRNSNKCQLCNWLSSSTNSLAVTMTMTLTQCFTVMHSTYCTQYCYYRIRICERNCWTCPSLTAVSWQQPSTEEEQRHVTAYKVRNASCDMLPSSYRLRVVHAGCQHWVPASCRQSTHMPVVRLDVPRRRRRHRHGPTRNRLVFNSNGPTTSTCKCNTIERKTLTNKMCVKTLIMIKKLIVWLTRLNNLIAWQSWQLYWLRFDVHQTFCW